MVEHKERNFSQPPLMELLDTGKPTRPEIVGDRLVYPNLQSPSVGITEQINQFVHGGDTEEGRHIREQLAEGLYLSHRLLTTAAILTRAADPSDQKTLAAEYTNINSQLFGKPDEEIASEILVSQYHTLQESASHLTTPEEQHALSRQLKFIKRDIRRRTFGPNGKS